MTQWSQLRSQIVLWEDACSLIVNKPAGLSVMGERHETDLLTIAALAGEPLWWVNRIDKVTSGAVLLAKTLKAHGALTRQFAKRDVGKAYFAICQPGGLPERGAIDLPLMTAGSGRVRVAAERHHIQCDRASGLWHVEPDTLFGCRNYPSVTRYVKLWEGAEHTVLLAMPVTGRRHQIRVHLAWIGHAIVGDPLFLKKKDSPQPRTCLHSWQIAFESVGAAPRWTEVRAQPGADFWAGIQRFAPPSPDWFLETADKALHHLA